MNPIAQRYRKHADGFEHRVAAVHPGQWANPSPCEHWTARDVVRHVIDMHGVMLRPIGRQRSPGLSVDDDPLGAFRAARVDVEAVLHDEALSTTLCDTPAGRVTVGQHIDEVASDDLVIHGWDLARATGQDDTIDPDDVVRIWEATTALAAELLERMRTPGAFGPGVQVYGPEVAVPEHAPLQDRLLGLLGRHPAWDPSLRG